jgi:hypothetical protein
MWKSQRLELFMCIYIIYACSLQKTNTTSIRWYYVPCDKQLNEVGALWYQDIKVINMHDNNTKQISSRMLTYMVEHGLLLVPFMNECKTRGVCPYVQLSNSPKIMKYESHHVWKLLYYTLYVIDVCVRPLKIQHIGLSRYYYVCKQTTTIGWAFWSQDIKVTTMHHMLNNKTPSKLLVCWGKQTKIHTLLHFIPFLHKKYLPCTMQVYSTSFNPCSTTTHENITCSMLM